MADDTTTYWFAIRVVYLFGKKQDGKNIFEERIVVFSANTEDEAFEKAEREADQYAAGHSPILEQHPCMELYSQEGDSLIDGYEVWSKLYESEEDLESFYKSKYDRYDYRPDP